MPEHPRNAKPDLPDLRDRMYEPSLEELARRLDPDVGPEEILNQGREGACTGFALAAVINRMSKKPGVPDGCVSPRMLYEMAKRFDEWEGEEYEGSSIRGAIRGWKNSGVCLDKTWPYEQDRPGNLTINRAKEARSCTVGAYYRVRPSVSDFHAALNESGAIAVSAHVHPGWDRPRKTIRFNKERDGGHAFAVVGYNEKGFWVQNSWGRRWGSDGIALWTYEDWAHNVMDAWVVQLALPTPQIFGVKPGASVIAEEAAGTKASVPRAEIAGHFVHVDDGKFKEKGRYWSSNDDVKQTAALIARSDKYDHLLIYAHGGLNAPAASARRVRAMRDPFKRNRIYPYHVMYDTGLGEELKDILLRKGKDAKARVGGLTEWLDRRIEAAARPLGTRLWDEMKNDALIAFEPAGAGTKSLKHFLRELRKPDAKPKKIHLVGHSTGGILIAHLLHALRNEAVPIETCTLLAPACRVDLYNERYLPVLTNKTNLRLGKLDVLNLSKRLERDDNVARIYRKSLLHLVSRAFERSDKPQALLGMEKFADEVDPAGGKTRLVFSDGTSGNVTHSRSHGGFDNDVTTMNHVLRTVLGKMPSATRRFQKEELKY